MVTLKELQDDFISYTECSFKELEFQSLDYFVTYFSGTSLVYFRIESKIYLNMIEDTYVA